MSDLFDGLDLKEAEYTLPNGKSLKLVPMDLFDRIEIQKKIQDLAKKGESSKSELFKEVAKKTVVNDNYEPFLTDVDLNKLSRASNGEILFEIFNKVMELSGATGDQEKSAKKK